jgi:hypothetical protein
VPCDNLSGNATSFFFDRVIFFAGIFDSSDRGRANHILDLPVEPQSKKVRSEVPPPCEARQRCLKYPFHLDRTPFSNRKSRLI